LESIDVLWLAIVHIGQWKAEVDASEVAHDLSFQREKTLVLKKAYAGCCEPDRVHTQAEILVGHVHVCVALLTGHVPIDILVCVSDWILFSVGVELCKLSLALQSRCLLRKRYEWSYSSIFKSYLAKER